MKYFIGSLVALATYQMYTTF